MKARDIFVLTVAMAGAAVLSGCQTGNTGQAPTQEKTVPGANVNEQGLLVFTAQGQSVAKAGEGAMGIAKARIAAETIAKANLLEVVKGALITGSVTVGDMAFESQAVSAQVNGWLSGAEVKTSVPDTMQSRLPGAKPVDQLITSTATLKLSPAALKNLREFVE